MFQTGDIKHSETYETSDKTENLSMCDSEKRARCKVKEGNTDQDENSPPTRTGGPADNADIAATKVKNVKIQTKDSEEEETLTEPGKGALIETEKEGPRLEKNRTEAEEKVHYKQLELPVKECMLSKKEIPGSWKTGDVPSSTLTAPKFSQTNKNKISAQRYPCFVPKSTKKVSILGYIHNIISNVEFRLIRKRSVSLPLHPEPKINLKTLKQ